MTSPTFFQTQTCLQCIGVEEEFFHTPDFVSTVHELLHNFPVDNANFAAALKSGNAEWPEKLRKEIKKEYDSAQLPLPPISIA